MMTYSYRSLVVLVFVCLAISGLGCEDWHGERTGQKTVKANPPKAIQDWIDHYLPSLRKIGFPDISMEPVITQGKWKVLVSGRVVSQTEAGNKDAKMILPGLLSISEPPADFVWQVRYEVVPPPGRNH